MLINIPFRQRNILILPELRQKMLAEIRVRFEKEIEPDVWRSFIIALEDGVLEHDYEDFLNATDSIVRDVVNELGNDLEGSIKVDLVNELWEESQSFWYELSEPIKWRLSFIHKLLTDAQKEILTTFPDAENVLGITATELLIDAAFQHNLYSYYKVYKPDLVDLRRMTNIFGQVVEDIFRIKIFKDEPNVGQIHNLLTNVLNGKEQKIGVFKNSSINSKPLFERNFLNNLKTVVRFRNKYSHGTNSKETIENDFNEMINALFKEGSGVLRVIYIVLERNQHLN